MSKFGKIRNKSGKTSTHRAENIFLKYLLYNVHEIALKYPREKKRYSSFSNSIYCILISAEVFMQLLIFDRLTLGLLFMPFFYFEIIVLML